MSPGGMPDSPRVPEEAHRSGGWVAKDLEFVPEAWSLKGEELPGPQGQSVTCSNSSTCRSGPRRPLR